MRTNERRREGGEGRPRGHISPRRSHLSEWRRYDKMAERYDVTREPRSIDLKADKAFCDLQDANISVCPLLLSCDG
ncbi:hypothetical protein Trydic_g18015 [Trypoxylus dichotomus]